jgi:hypothetical protein
VHSVSATPLLAALGLAAVAALAIVVLGFSHTTTQQTSGRLSVEGKRNVVGQKPIRVSGPDHTVKVVRTSLVRAGKSTALVALLRNVSSTTVNDLPLAAGVSKGGKPDYVNLKGASYFQAHAPAMEPGAEATWVLSGGKPLPAGAPVATVMRPKGRLPSKATTLPTLKVGAVGPAKGGAATAQISNPTSIPQYRFEVYAWARKGGRYVAAGHTDVAFLDGGESAVVRVPLVGDPKDARIHVEAPPTIFN